MLLTNLIKNKNRKRQMLTNKNTVKHLLVWAVAYSFYIQTFFTPYVINISCAYLHLQLHQNICRIWNRVVIMST